jgi:hypothetical protein
VKAAENDATDGDGRIGNDAAFSMNDVWAKTAADGL